MATTLGAVAEGSIVYLNESGVAVPFYVACHNYESALNGDGRTLLVRQEAWPTSMAWDAGGVNAYSGSDIDVWLNGTYKALLDSFVQTAMATTTFYYTPGNGNTTVTTLARAVFALSTTELGAQGAAANVEGTKLPSADILRNQSYTQATRSPNFGNSNYAYYVINGTAMNGSTNGTSRPRPALSLPKTQVVDDDNNITSGEENPPTEPEIKEYTKLEYIEGTGAQWINSKYTPPTNNLRIVCDYEYTSLRQGMSPYGVQYNGTFSVIPHTTTASTQGIYVGSSTDLLNFAVKTNARYNLDLSASNSVLTQKLNGVTSTASYSGTLNAGGNIYIFAQNVNGSPYSPISPMRLYSLQIYDNGTLVRDFIPARRNSDGAIGLLDQVNNVFYGNAGTGTFTAGPVAEYTWLEWIESSGTQYVDTGYVPNQDTRTVMDFEYTKTVSGAQQGVFGSRIALRNAMYLMWTENGNTGWRDGYGTELEYPLGAAISGRTVVDKNKNVLSINGTVVNAATYATFDSAYSLYLLTTNNAGSPMIDSYPTYAKIYSCQIYDNGTLVRDFKPARRSDGTVGLLDQVNDRFYTNPGTGIFMAGPEIVESASMSLTAVDGTEVLITTCKCNVGGVECTISYALANVDGIEVMIPFGAASDLMEFRIETTPSSGTYETFEAEPGMTWEEWCDSDYNIAGFYVQTYGSSSWIERSISGGAVSVQYDGSDVSPSDEIGDGTQYTVEWAI